MKYSIVIPTYNHCDDLLKPCLESIFKYTNMDNVEIVIVANGCTDNTHEYLNTVFDKFNTLGFANHFKPVIEHSPLGYAGATNLGIKESTGEKIILLNNDTVLLEQQKNAWLNLLEIPFLLNPNCGITGPLKVYSQEISKDFVIFFCAMVDRKVFNDIGLLNLEYGQGGCEDMEFCVKAQEAGFQILQCTQTYGVQENLNIGYFPIYHAGEKTVLDESLTPGYRKTFRKNQLTLSKKYNREYYKYLLTNNFERHVNLNGEEVPRREAARYKWAASKANQGSVLEIGCSSGFGSQFFNDNIDYLGLDYDEEIVKVAELEFKNEKRNFSWADINTYDLGYYDTIVAFEVIEHLDNGLQIVEKLKKHCNKLLISVPYKEPPGFWGEHHRLHMLDESHLPGFKYVFCNEQGDLKDTPFQDSSFNLMLCEYDAK